jgi:tryptophan halogenase
VLPNHPLHTLAFRPEAIESSRAVFDDIRRRQSALAEELPSTYQYLRQLHGK